MDPQNPQWSQNANVEYLNNQQIHSAYQAQNPVLNFNRQEFSGILSASAPEFIPKAIPLHDWHTQQRPPAGIEQPHQLYGMRPQFMNHQQPIQPIVPHLPPQQQQQQQHPIHSMHHQHQHPHQHQHQQQHHYFPNQQQQQQQQQPQQQPPHFQQPFMMMNNNNQPRPEYQGHHRGSIQNRLQQIQHETAAPPQQHPENEGTHKQTEGEEAALDYLSEVISKLNDNPGMFENCQKKLREMFLEMASNHFVISNAIEVIFEHSIEEQNFRYTGARLCLILDNLDPSPESTFRSLLSMKMEYQQSELVKYMQNEQRRVRGTTLFLAELFVQLKKPDDPRNMADISRYVLNSILLLLSKHGPENIKCVCQTLKLSGYELQNENPTDVEEAITQLKFIAEEQNVQTKRLIQSVVDLFYDNWGRRDVEAVENQTPIIPENIPQNFNDGPVFYGPDGQIISEEENSFLVSNINPYPININEILDEDNYDLDDDDDDEPEMDYEIRMAFEEFAKNQK
jgi:polyadenylate-binding protein-interacting protein 1